MHDLVFSPQKNIIVEYLHEIEEVAFYANNQQMNFRFNHKMHNHNGKLNCKQFVWCHLT